MKTEQDGSHLYNHSDCSNSPQSQQLSDRSLSSTSSAKDLDDLSKLQKTKGDASVENNCSNNNEYKMYLCNYCFQNSTWSINIPAKSWNEAEKRMAAIAMSGKIVGELETRISLPGIPPWLKKVKLLFTSN